MGTPTNKKTPQIWSFEMSAEGIEPSTNGLKGHCSAIELRARAKKHSIMPKYNRQQNGLKFLEVLYG
jgi:hypothetical protein